MNTVPMRRSTRASTRDVDDGDGTSVEQLPTSEDTTVSPPLGNEGTSYIDPSVGVVEGSTMDWIRNAAILEVNPPMGVQTSNVVLRGNAAEDNTAHTMHSRGERQVGVEEQEKIVTHVSTVSDDIMGRTTEVQSAVDTILLGSTVREVV